MRRALILLFPLLSGLVAPMAADAFELKDALRMAVKQNPNLRAAQELEIQAKAQRDQSWALIQPSVSAGYQFRVNDREIAFDMADGLTSGLADAFTPIYGNLGFIYGQLFEAGELDAGDCDELAALNGFADCAELTAAFADGGLGADDGGGEETEPLIVQPKTQQFLNLQVQWPISPRVLSTHAAGQRNVEASRARIRQSRDQLMLTVVRAYAGAWQAQESVRVLQDQVGLAEAHLKDTQALESAGMITRDVLLRAQLEVERTRRTVRDAEMGARQARRGLAFAIGERDLNLETLAPLPDITITRPDAAHLTEEALDARPEPAAAVAQVGAAKALEVDSALQFLPQFAITGNLNWSDSVSGFDDIRTSWYIGLGVSLPIWDGGVKIQNTRAAASQRRQALANLEAARQQVALEVENAWDGYETKRGAIAVAQLERDLAAEAFRLVQVRYQAGRSRQVELLDAQTQLAFAELTLLQARADEELAAAELLAAAGRVGEIGE